MVKEQKKDLKKNEKNDMYKLVKKEADRRSGSSYKRKFWWEQDIGGLQ